MPGKSSKVDCVCGHCGKAFQVFPCHIRQGAGKHCSPGCARRNAPRRPIAERFEAFVDRTSDPSGCHTWRGHVDRGGYGQFARDPSKMVGAHRMAWELSNGPIPDGFDVCHSCDHSPCVRLSHLFLGTARDNMRDAIAKNRIPMGENRTRSKLTDATVRRIRIDYAAGGVTQDELARRFGVTQPLVAQVINGKAWQHVT